MKKIIALCLVVFLIAGFSGCNKKPIEPDSSTPTETSAANENTEESSLADNDNTSTEEDSETASDPADSTSNPSGAGTQSGTPSDTTPNTPNQNGNSVPTQPQTVNPTGVNLDITAKTLEIGGTFQLTAAVSPANASNKAVTWDSDNKNVATIDNGKVTAKAAGTAFITVRTSNGKTAVCTVTVNAPKPQSPYARPFDIAKIKEDLIAYGKSLGMTHVTHMTEGLGGAKITLDNSSWMPPIETWLYSNTEQSVAKLKEDGYSDIMYWKNRGIPTFTIWIDPDPNRSGEYIIYVIIA